MYNMQTQNSHSFSTNEFNRGNNQQCKNLPKKKKFNFICFKKNMCNSLNEIECFLNKFSVAGKYLKIYNLLKK